MKLTDYVAQFFVERGVSHAYMFTGGAVAHLIDSCWRAHESNPAVLRPVCVMHEQAGAMAIDAQARVTGEPGVMMATSGPGATNLLTGIACSFYDSIPGIYITGQVRTWELKGESRQRQLGFQETDIVAMAKPVTKYAVLVKDPADIRYELEKSWWLATSVRPGPVLLDLPMDLQWAEIDPLQLRPFTPPRAATAELPRDRLKIEQVITWLREAERPLILAGGGVRNGGAVEEMLNLVEALQLPVVTSFGGKDSFPHDHHLFAGVVGTMGNRAANGAVQESDLLLVLGSRLSWRQVRSTPERFAHHARIIHVDIDQDELNQHVQAAMVFDWDVCHFIDQLLDGVQQGERIEHAGWGAVCRQRLQQTPFVDPHSDLMDRVGPYQFMRSLSSRLASRDVVVLDTGQNVMWGIQALELRDQQRLLTAWGHSPMGYSLPAALGVAAVAAADQRVICLIGDGGVQLNIQELQTLYSYQLPVKIFVLNNHGYGAIKDFNRDNLDGRYYATTPEYGYIPPDFSAIASAYRIPVITIDTSVDLEHQIEAVLEHEGGVFCVVELGTETVVQLDPFQ